MYYACFVAKAGTSSWLEVVYRQHLGDEYDTFFLNHKLHERASVPQRGLYLRRPRKMPQYDVWKRLDDAATDVINNSSYFKFAVVRHPWNRLVSAFIDKYHEDCKSHRRCLHSQFALNVNTTSTEPFTLTELLEVLIRMQPPSINEHFASAVDLCEMNHMEYDFIGDLGDPDNNNFLLNRTHNTGPLPHENGPKGAMIASRVACDETTVLLAKHYFQKDLRKFGYTLDDAHEACAKYGVAVKPKE